MNSDQTETKFKLIIIIGLPGSGKTTLAKEYNSYLIFDDFITKFYNGKMIDAIEKNFNVCITDPRMCIPEIFDKYMTKFLSILNKDQILLILFENNSQQCLINLSNRSDNRFGIERTIQVYSTKYCLKYYNKYQSQIMAVHSGRE